MNVLKHDTSVLRIYLRVVVAPADDAQHPVADVSIKFSLTKAVLDKADAFFQKQTPCGKTVKEGTQAVHLLSCQPVFPDKQPVDEFLCEYVQLVKIQAG